MVVGDQDLSSQRLAPSEARKWRRGPSASPESTSTSQALEGTRRGSNVASQRLPGPLLPRGAPRMRSTTLEKEARRGRRERGDSHARFEGRGEETEARAPVEPGTRSKERKRKCPAGQGTACAPFPTPRPLWVIGGPLDGFSRLTEISS